MIYLNETRKIYLFKVGSKFEKGNAGRGPGCVTRRLLATLEDRSSIPGAGNNNVLVTRSDWPLYGKFTGLVLTLRLT